MFNPGQETASYLCRVKRHIRPNGERFVTVVDDSGVPAYYPTALALLRRSRDPSAETLASKATDLVHIGLWAVPERIDVNARLEAGAYFGPVAVETLAEASGLKSDSLSRVTSQAVSEIRRGVSFSKADLVTNQQKSRRLTTALRYFEFVGRMSDAWLPWRSSELADRIVARQDDVLTRSRCHQSCRTGSAYGIRNNLSPLGGHLAGSTILQKRPRTARDSDGSDFPATGLSLALRRWREGGFSPLPGTCAPYFRTAEYSARASVCSEESPLVAQFMPRCDAAKDLTNCAGRWFPVFQNIFLLGKRGHRNGFRPMFARRLCTGRVRWRSATAPRPDHIPKNNKGGTE